MAKLLLKHARTPPVLYRFVGDDILKVSKFSIQPTSLYSILFNSNRNIYLFQHLIFLIGNLTVETTFFYDRYRLSYLQ